MAIAYRGGGSASDASATSVSCTMSATAQNGDYLIAVVAYDATSATVTWPSGFTQRGTASSTQDGGLCYWADKVAGASEPSSYTISVSDGANNIAGAVVAYSGVDNTTPRDVTPTANSSSAANASPRTLTATGVASGNANRWLVAIGSSDNVTLGTVTNAVPAASPSTWTERIDVSDAEFVNIGISDCLDSAGTYTSNVTFQQTGGGNGGWMAFLIALREAGGTAAGAIPPELLTPQRRFQHMMVR